MTISRMALFTIRDKTCSLHFRLAAMIRMKKTNREGVTPEDQSRFNDAYIYALLLLVRVAESLKRYHSVS